MKLRDILVVVTSPSEDEHVIAYAEQLRRQWSARITTLVVRWKPALVLTNAPEALRAEIERTTTRLQREAEAGPVVSELVRIEDVRSVIGMRARHFDAVVVGRPAAPTCDWPHALLEGALFESGRPVFVVPAGWKAGPIGNSILVCWKPTREAARALGAAGDLLGAAARVMVATAGRRNEQASEAAKANAGVIAHLARKNVKVNLLHVDPGDGSEAEAILEHAEKVRADLIVMGGYGRSAATQFFLGGVTREMLAMSDIPLLMAH